MTMALSAMVVGCANRGIGPQGGPRDETPPTLLREQPASGTTHFNAKKVSLTFNEYLQLDNVADNVLISPPSRQQPEVKVRGKNIDIVFRDTLLPNTTYSVSFGRAICDYHERNAFADYTYSFSTGDVIDTLELGGMVVLAENLNPVSRCLVGIHRSMADSALSKLAFTQIARTDTSGVFYIHNIHEGQYRLYGLMDGSRDNLYQPGEALAYLDAPVRVGEDTQENYPVLYLFEEDKRRLYLGRTTREQRHLIQTVFAAPQDTMPTIVAPWRNRVFVDASARYDTIRLWLLDSVDIAMDTLEMEMTYRWTDSLYNIGAKTDTISAIYRAPRMSERAKKKAEEAARTRTVKIGSNASGKFQVYDTLRLDFDYPLRSLTDTLFHLAYMRDTTPVPVTINGIVPVDSTHLHYHVLASLRAGEKYTMTADSAAVTDIYGHVCHASKLSLTVRKREEYSTLRVRLAHYDERAVIQLLNKQDVPVRTMRATADGVLFDYLDPDTYYMRLFLDMNGDGRWTTGDWSLKRQPEPVCYFPNSLNLKANWDFEEVFDHMAIDPLDSKPGELIRVYTGKKK